MFGKQAPFLFRRPTDNAPLHYLLYLPETYRQHQDKAWPLVLFLHGGGECGNSEDALIKVTTHGIARLIKEGQSFPFIAVSPQCPAEAWWTEKIEVLHSLLDEIEQTYVIDHDRVYVTGLSIGGFGTWAMAIAQPHRFAALAPICGGGDPTQVCAIKHIPVWNFHGAQDTKVPLHRSVEMVETLKACGGNVRFTIYPDAKHNAWTRTYANPELYTWLLSHRRKPQRDS
jgi:predicted peptidase